jgi:hypothetical protein
MSTNATELTMSILLGSDWKTVVFLFGSAQAKFPLAGVSNDYISFSYRGNVLVRQQKEC